MHQVSSDVMSLLCMPIYNPEHDVIAVVEAVNKQTQDSFSLDDEKVYHLDLERDLDLDIHAKDGMTITQHAFVELPKQT